jgi:hypothetical protein
MSNLGGLLLLGLFLFLAAFSWPVAQYWATTWAGISTIWLVPPFVALFVLALARANYEEYSRVQKGWADASRDLEAITRGAPRLRAVRYFCDRRRLGYPGLDLGEVCFAHVIVKNDPETPAPTAVATVLAEITYQDESGSELLDVRGRWGDTDQPVNRPPTQSTVDLQTVEIGIGMSRELNLAMKYPGDAECYGFSNTTYLVPDWRFPEYRLSGSRFKITVRLRGPYIDTAFAFWLSHTGRYSDLTLTLADPPMRGTGEPSPPVAG